MNYFETNLEEISRSIQLLAQIFEYQVFELQVEEKDENQTGYVPYKKVQRLTVRRVPREIHRVQEREEQRMLETVQMSFNAEFLTKYNISLRFSPSPFQGEGWGEGGCPHDTYND